MLNIKFFITPFYPYGNDHYYHEIIALAEGFQALGCRISGNVNYWWQPEQQSFLIKESVTDGDFDVAVYDYRYVRSFEHLLFRKGYPNFDKNKKHILIDRNDWLEPIWRKNENYRIFDFIFAGNLFRKEKYPENVRPWAIGLTNRIISSIDRYYDVEKLREKVVGYNFRVDHNMRGYLLKNLQRELQRYPAVEKLTKPVFDSEIDEYYYRATTARHNPAYFNLLCSTQFFMAFGGYFEMKPRMYLPYSIIDKLRRKPFYWSYKRLISADRDFSDKVFVFQFDNFRFWEVLYSGSIAINLDHEYWEFLLPVAPAANVHYVSIKKLKENNVESIISKLSDHEMGSISKSGRDWVVQNYAPAAQAKRVLQWLQVT